MPDKSVTQPKDTNADVMNVATVAATLLSGYFPLVFVAGSGALALTSRDHAAAGWAVGLARAIVAQATALAEQDAAPTPQDRDRAAPVG